VVFTCCSTCVCVFERQPGFHQLRTVSRATAPHTRWNTSTNVNHCSHQQAGWPTDPQRERDIMRAVCDALRSALCAAGLAAPTTRTPPPALPPTPAATASRDKRRSVSFCGGLCPPGGAAHRQHSQSRTPCPARSCHAGNFDFSYTPTPLLPPLAACTVFVTLRHLCSSM
jgi:hypothetical protein